ncbi:MAG: SMC-Scp complex subunit ScpB [Dissulfurispiraceae bacterium]|jgi:segregation and condensation protein B|nr:SMC-Scp complex subunit ScpB [Dissulfurispiraceae bacterium]
MAMDNIQAKSIVESLLFVAGEPVTCSAIAKLTDIPEADVKHYLNELSESYKTRASGIIITEIADGFQMITNPDNGFWVRKLRNINQSSKLSQAALETLAIIAYKQPLTKVEVDQLRGVNSDGAVKTLVDRRLIKIIGKKEAPGRPFLYGTTKEFLQYFGLKNLAELPSLSDFLKEDAA